MKTIMPFNFIQEQANCQTIWSAVLQTRAYNGHHQGRAGGGREHHPVGAGDEGGRDARVKDGRVVHRLAQTFTDRLRHPEEGVSPGYVKSRRRKKPDGLVQSRIIQFSKKEQIVPSVGLHSVPSGGPWDISKSERGFKRGLGDQLVGPIALKRFRKD